MTASSKKTPEAIYATIEARIEHIDGPEITDTAHVLNWLLGDGAQYVIRSGDQIEFVACTVHASPDDCDFDCDDKPEAVFRVHLVAAS